MKAKSTAETVLDDLLIALAVLVLVIPAVYLITITVSTPLPTSTYTGTLQTLCCEGPNAPTLFTTGAVVLAASLILGAFYLYLWFIGPSLTPFAAFWNRVEEKP